jgi:hypothetical protein
MSATKTIVSIHLTADQYLAYYRGAVKYVQTQDHLGRRVQFPANLLQKFVSQEGVQGVFEICYSSEGKFLSIQRLDIHQPRGN